MKYEHIKGDTFQDVFVMMFVKEKLESVEEVNQAGREIRSMSDVRENLIFDLSNVKYLGEQMIAEIVRLHRILFQSGNKLILCGVQKDVLEKLQRMHLNKLLFITEDRQTALEQL